MSNCGKVTLGLGYTLLKFGTNWLSLVENITVLLTGLGCSDFAFFFVKLALFQSVLFHGFCSYNPLKWLQLPC